MKLVFNPVSGQFDFIREIDQSVSKTLAYNVDGTLASLTGTGVYKTKTFTYVGGVLTEVTV